MKADDWEVYVTSRLSAPPPTSPAPLLQEWYCADVWRLLCCCCLMSRVSSGATKHRCLAAFFALYPTPSAFLAAATEEKGSLAPLREGAHRRLARGACGGRRGIAAAHGPGRLGS